MIKVGVIYDHIERERAVALAQEIREFLDEKGLHNGIMDYTNMSTAPEIIFIGVTKVCIPSA